MAAGKVQQSEETPVLNEISTPETRGIIPKEILEDPEYPKIRQEVQAEVQLTKNNGQGQAVNSEEEIDRKVVEAFQTLAAKRAELQKMSSTNENEADA